jgi:hypothetical protein
MRNMLLFSLLMVFWSCTEPITPVDTIPPKDWTPEIVWKKQHGPSKFDQLAFRIEIYKDKLIAGYQNEINSGYWIYDKNNGDVLKDIKVDDSFLGEYLSKLIDKYYVCIIKNRMLRLINMETGEVTFSPELGFWGTSRLVFHDNYFYLGSNSFEPSNRVLFSRIRMDKLSEPWEIFLREDWPQDVSNPRSSHAFCEGVRLNESGDHIFYYGNTQLYTDTFPKERLRITAYNIDQKKILWQIPIDRIKEVYPASGAGPHKPFFYDNKVLMFSTGYIWAFDQNTGKLIWQKNLEQITNTEYMVLGRYLYILDNLGKMYKIDINNGDISKTLQVQGTTGAWQEYKNILYFTTADGSLYAIDPDKMAVKWKWKSDNINICSYCSFANNSPIIDKEKNRLYITDGREMFCIKLPE